MFASLSDRLGGVFCNGVTERLGSHLFHRLFRGVDDPGGADVRDDVLVGVAFFLGRGRNLNNRNVIVPTTSPSWSRKV